MNQPLSVKEAARLLREGKLVAFPTETVYGLGAAVFNPDAVASIFAVKGRPRDNPLIVHIRNLRDLDRIAVDIPPLFFRLYARFFPGPLTVVLKKHPDVPAIVSAGMDTIAVRMPAHLVAQELIKAVGEPLAAPSANLSGKPSATEARHVIDDFGDKIAGVVNGGPTLYGLESTVVSLLSDPPVILRPGRIGRAEIEEALGTPVRLKDASDAVISPGMKYRHYAPNAQVRVFYDQGDLLQALKPDSIVLSTEKIGDRHVKLAPETLYRVLRDADRAGCKEILVFCDEAARQNQALMNRLLHAAVK